MVDVAVDIGSDYANGHGVYNYPVHRAVQLCQESHLRHLISRGESVNQGTFDSVTPLHEACLAGNLSCVYILLDAGAVVNARNVDGATPLCDAANNGNSECVELLIRHGAEVNPELSLSAPLHEAVMRDNWEAISILISAGANLNANDLHYGTPIHIAAHKNYVNSARRLLSAGANVNASKMHQVPLHVAAHNNNVAMAALLLDHGAGIYARNNWGRTPLDLAIPMSDTAKLLVYWQRNVPRLIHLSRLVVRQAVGPHRLQQLGQLGLPPSATAFLQYTHWKPLTDNWMETCSILVACL